MEIGEYKCEVCPRKRTRKPKKNVIDRFEDGEPMAWEHICSSCGRNLDVSYKFCPECGQALDWSEINGEDIRE